MTSLDDSSLESHVDSWSAGRLRGWAWRPANPAAVVTVEAMIDGRVVASGPALLKRGDLGHRRGGACGFELLVDLPEGASAAIELRDAASGAKLIGSPLRVEDAGAAPPPPPSALPAIVGFRGSVDGCNGESVHGWILPPEPGGKPLVLDLFEGDQLIVTVTADGWRNDLEDGRDGDGACAFNIPFPQSLAGGAVHDLDLRIHGGKSILNRPIRAVIPHRKILPKRARPAWRLGRRCRISFVVVFYNMRREAERTLHSLSRAYQIGIEDLDYEVLCIDNGSKEPLDPQWIASFGPEFRLVPTSRILPSPCFAMNEAASMARGDRIAVMIDGAHVLSPGAVREAMKAMDDRPGCVVGLRQWFVNGDQRWLAAAGYSRAHEDKLFKKIAWPSNGYGLFQISTPMFESPNHWFDGLNESNCLFLDMKLWRKIGGIDEAFSEPGAGLANLDLFVRAVEASGQRVITLLGEASFHQYHGGTTTNVDDHTKDELVEVYKAHYRELRGKEFKGIGQNDLAVRGTIHTDQALTARQNLLFPGTVGVTNRLRPVKQEEWFEEEAQAFARTIYAESGMHRRTLWLGEPVDLAPADLTNIQEIMRVDRPRTIVIAEDRKGLAGFARSSIRELGLDCRIVHVRPGHEGAAPEGSVHVAGGVVEEATLQQVREAIGGDGPVMVLFEPHADDWFPVESLARYAELVTPGAMLVLLRTGIGQPWMGYMHNRSSMAARQLGKRGDFELEMQWQEQMIVLCPFGYLRRKK